MLAHSFLIKSSSKLLVTRTGIKARIDFGPLVSMAHLYVFEMRFDLGTLVSGERSLPFGLLFYTDRSKAVLLLWFLTVLAVCVYTLVQLLC